MTKTADRDLSHRTLTIAGLLAAALGLAACAARAEAPAAAPAATTVPGALVVDMDKFNSWRATFRTKALKEGISEATFDRALGGITPNPKVMEANDRQPEFTRPVWEYLDGAVSDQRISNGRVRYVDHQGLYTRLERKYGVEGRFLVAIWGLETSYGAITGGHNLFEALATLAYDGRRTAYGESQLLAALKIVERGDKPFDRMVGSWAGAIGQTQFIPTTYLQYAVDEDGDGRRDLFDSVPDVMASTANYLASSGWRQGESWGREVVLPADFDYALAGEKDGLPYSKWRALGVMNTERALVPDSNIVASLLVPAGHRGPAFLTLANFNAILRYNNSTSYALAIGHLADRIIGGPPFKAEWPRDERPLSLSERIELQELLNKMGYEVGEPDGIVGAKTRAGLRAFQAKQGLPADGFATANLLELVRKVAENS